MLPNIIRTTLVFLAMLVFWPVQLMAQQRAPLTPWYLGVKGGAIFTDGDRSASNGSLLGIELGHRWSPASAMELEVYSSSTEFDAGFDLDQDVLKVNYILTNPVPLWRPYVLFGGGAYRYKAPGESDTGLVVAVATGGEWDLNGNGLMLRAELRYRYTSDESKTPGLQKKGEPIFSLGLTFPLSWK